MNGYADPPGGIDSAMKIIAKFMQAARYVKDA
jgi:hypothetical protein